ncbi:RNA polymerase factor sigma-54 [Chelatococcus reniformis]|uniref:RNA polymerase sigma-54 factor n=1 Tax=Chelatococcus reniformis TaxID=1494448 RepID=A0A916TWL7_9HYPH|nr:RNA polymerase factor sigma-54 [Chelatococcus reniformis]GGC46603.1 RNA polymerase sigma-54 factor 2 [Chelatococcus reniformis]
MALSHRMEVRQAQSLVMTPQLLQAIKLLQLSHLELASYVDAELERNPFLERNDGDTPAETPPGAEPQAAEAVPETAESWYSQDLEVSRDSMEAKLGTGLENVFEDDGPVRASAGAAAEDGLSVSTPLWSGAQGGGSFEGGESDTMATLSAEVDLHSHLMRQLELITTDQRQRLIGSFLIDAIDEAGYLEEDLVGLAERLAIPLAAAEEVLNLVQGLEPAGVGARTLAECLALQLKEQNRLDPAMQALLERLDLVARRDLAALKRLCGVDDEDLADMLVEIKRLDPKPGRAFGAAPVETLVPDVFVRAALDGSWLIELNTDTLPRVLVNQVYYAKVARAAKSDTDKSFLSDSLQSANWLTRSLEQRAKTILKVASEIVRQQDGFFARGVAYLRPLNLKTIADAIGMHESTVSRVTSNKSIGTSRGTFEMKYFFSASIASTPGGEAHSAEAVRHRIRRMIETERASDVLSDDAIVRKLRDDGIDIARRTVAKYRESLRIPSSVERRREKLEAMGTAAASR